MLRLRLRNLVFAKLAENTKAKFPDENIAEQTSILEHTFSVEIIKWKRLFIKTYWKPAHIFLDVQGLVSDGKALDAIRREVVDLPHCCVTTQGTSCTSFSSHCNVSSGKRAGNDTIDNDDTVSANTFNGAASYVFFVFRCIMVSSPSSLSYFMA